jgi:hypothetical protein
MDAFPPGMPFTLQLTAVLVEFVTVAVRVSEVPNKSEALVGVTVRATAGVVGGGEALTEPAPPPTQPSKSSPAARHRKNGNAELSVLEILECESVHRTHAEFCERGRMQGGMQAKGQRKSKNGPFSRT